MATHVEIDIALPLGAGPDGHVALRVDIPDLRALTTADGRFLFAVMEKLGEWAPPGEPVEMPPVLREIGRRA